MHLHKITKKMKNFPNSKSSTCNLKWWRWLDHEPFARCQRIVSHPRNRQRFRTLSTLFILNLFLGLFFFKDLWFILCEFKSIFLQQNFKLLAMDFYLGKNFKLSIIFLKSKKIFKIIYVVKIGFIGNKFKDYLIILFCFLKCFMLVCIYVWFF